INGARAAARGARPARGRARPKRGAPRRSTRTRDTSAAARRARPGRGTGCEAAASRRRTAGSRGPARAADRRRPARSRPGWRRSRGGPRPPACFIIARRPAATAPAGAGGREPPHFPRAPNPLERGPMAPDGDERVKIVVYYAVWATACALVAGAAISAIHTAFFSYHPGRSGAARTLVGDLAAAAALAAGQGAVALVTGRILVRLGRTLRA